jgi:hypothetical protein
LDIVNCRAGLATAKRRSYFVWSFVRHPFARLFSGYAMAASMQRRRRGSFNVTFRDFALATQGERRRMSVTSADHYVPQALFLTDRRRCPVFDYVGRLESYADDLGRVLREIERRAGAPTPLMVHYRNSLGSDGRIEASNGTAFGKKFGKKSGERNRNAAMASAFSDADVVEKIIKEYKRDFELSGYSKEWGPASL